MTTDTTTFLPAPAAPRLRASDAERADIVARLHHALGEGRLDLAETEVRVTAVYAARYRDELDPLLDDLPETGAPPRDGPPTWGAIWTMLVWRARLAVLGGGAGNTSPTGRQRRTAAVLLVVAVGWALVCAFLGAAAVGR